MTWIIVAASLAYGLPGWRWVFRWVYETNYPHNRNDLGLLLGFSIFLATILFWSWRLWLGVFFCQHISDHDTHKFARIIGGRSRAQKRRDAQTEKKQRLRNIERAEREVGILPLECDRIHYE